MVSEPKLVGERGPHLSGRGGSRRQGVPRRLAQRDAKRPRVHGGAKGRPAAKQLGSTVAKSPKINAVSPLRGKSVHKAPARVSLVSSKGFAWAGGTGAESGGCAGCTKRNTKLKHVRIKTRNVMLKTQHFTLKTQHHMLKTQNTTRKTQIEHLKLKKLARKLNI